MAKIQFYYYIEGIWFMLESGTLLHKHSENSTLQLQALEKLFTLEECLALEALKGIRFEYLNDTVKAMAGATPPHNQIARNLIKYLEDCLAEKGCTLLDRDDKLSVPHCGTKGGYVYPDVHIYCTQPLAFIHLNDQERNIAFQNPHTIIEVLFQDTRKYDQTDKYECYRGLPSLQQYIMIDSELVSVTIKKRIDAQSFQEVFLTNEDDLIDFSGCPLSLREVYHKYNRII